AAPRDRWRRPPPARWPAVTPAPARPPGTVRRWPTRRARYCRSCGRSTPRPAPSTSWSRSSPTVPASPSRSRPGSCCWGSSAPSRYAGPPARERQRGAITGSQAPAPTIAPCGTAARREHGDAVARAAPDASAPPGPAGGARLRPPARTARAGPAVRAVLPAGHPVHRRRCGGLDLAGPAVPGRGLLAHTDPAAVPAGLLGAADLQHPPAPASADDMDLPAGLLLRAHPHHRGGALGPDQPRRRRPRAGPARGDAPGRLGARRGADPRLRLV